MGVQEGLGYGKGDSGMQLAAQFSATLSPTLIPSRALTKGEEPVKQQPTIHHVHIRHWANKHFTSTIS